MRQNLILKLEHLKLDAEETPKARQPSQQQMNDTQNTVVRMNLCNSMKENCSDDANKIEFTVPSKLLPGMGPFVDLDSTKNASLAKNLDAIRASFMEIIQTFQSC